MIPVAVYTRYTLRDIQLRMPRWVAIDMTRHRPVSGRPWAGGEAFTATTGREHSVISFAGRVSPTYDTLRQYEYSKM